MDTPMSPPPPPPPPPPRSPGPPKLASSPPRLIARSEETFNSALARPPEERDAYLAQACSGDEALEAEVRALLAAHDSADDFMLANSPLSPEVEAELARLKPEEAGERIGPYKLLQQIGEGGFGAVWMAEQEQPVRRRVALKIIKLGMDTREVIARFEQERQALAMMEHPNIAKVFDAGATQYGRPYFVMELVRGMKITDYCDEQQLATEERLALFIHVCQAVQHAHQKGIIHRDIKPSNILVTVNDGEPVPKVIDFGVAKATQGRLTDATLFTKFEQMIGTPLYMSPEQAELTSLDIDTRSDIYSLGVLLYELLTGRTPIDTATMARAGMDEIRRLIREVDPPRPSARVKTLDGNELTTTAKRRHTDATKLPGALRGDLDWIVMKCLEKDRKRRYDTANGLAHDLQRHLANEIVTARPPTAAYLLGKLIRRNKLAFAASAAIAASLVIGMAATAWQLVRTREAERRALEALDELRATAPAFVEQARALVARDRFDEALQKLVYATKLRPKAPEYLIAQGDLLESQLRLADAAIAYRAALALHPDDNRAKAGVKLCEELLAAPVDQGGKLSRESLSKLHLAMQQEQRPAAEIMPVARLLGEEKTVVIDYWLARLKDLPISADRPLEKRLSVREDGLLSLDLSGTKIADLKPLSGMPLGSLNLNGCEQIRDGSLLDEFRSLRWLDLTNTDIGDLSPLRGLSLETLILDGTHVFEVAALRGMPLKKLSARNTRIADLSPLAGIPLIYFDGTSIPAVDYSPLAGAPLEKCIIQDSPLLDLSFLRDSPVKQLTLFNCNEARGFAVLAGLKSLNLLILPQSFRGLPDDELAAIGALRAHPTLKNIQTELRSGTFAINTTQSKDEFWQDWDREQTFVPALRERGLVFSLSKLASGTYRLSLENQTIGDLSILKGAPISELWLGGCKITDLAPLRDLRLRVLGLWSNPITDLGPLRGMRLEELSLEDTRVSDLSPLKEMPLKKLYLHGCTRVASVSVVAEILTLEKLTVPMSARNIEALRNLPRLRWLDFQADSKNPQFPASTTEQFWAMWPTLSWVRALNEAGIRYSAKQDGERMWKVSISAKEFEDCSVFKGASLRELDLNGTAVSNLAPLVGLPLKVLTLQRTSVTDLSPLASIPLQELRVHEVKATDLSFLTRAPLCDSLEKLWLERLEAVDFAPVAACHELRLFSAWDSPLTDLEPLRGRQLQEIFLAGSRVRDISVLAGMPLTRAYVDVSGITDLTPLLQCPTLKYLIIPKGARDLEALSKLPNLQRISTAYDEKVQGPSMTLAEFLIDLPAQRAGDPLAMGRYAEAEPSLAEALAATRKRFLTGDPGLVPAILKLANCRAWGDRYREAIPLFREILDIRKPGRTDTPNTTELVDWSNLVVMHAAAGDRDGYRTACAEMLRRCEGTKSEGVAERALLYTSIAPGGGIDEGQMRDLIETSRPMEKSPVAYWFRLAAGLADYRDGNLTAAGDALRKVDEFQDSAPFTMADIVLAMISHRAGNHDDATLRLERSRKAVADHWPLRQEKVIDVRNWQNWLAARLLLAEADASLAAPPSK